MAANVTVKGSALRDPRFAKLAKRVGLADGDHARAKLEHVWSYCTDECVHVIDAETFDLVAGVEGLAKAACLPEVDLAEETSRGIRVRGTKGMIEWKKKLRDNARKGGGQTRANWQAKRQAEGEAIARANLARPDEGQTPSPNTPSPSPSPSPSGEREYQQFPTPPVLASPQTRAPAKSKRQAKAEHELPDDWVPSAAHAAQADSLGVSLEAEARKFRAHAEANARKQVRWGAAFTGWLENAVNFGGKARASPGYGRGLTPQEIMDMDMSESPFRLKGGEG